MLSNPRAILLTLLAVSTWVYADQKTERESIHRAVVERYMKLRGDPPCGVKIHSMQEYVTAKDRPKFAPKGSRVWLLEISDPYTKGISAALVNPAKQVLFIQSRKHSLPEVWDEQEHYLNKGNP